MQKRDQSKSRHSIIQSTTRLSVKHKQAILQGPILRTVTIISCKSPSSQTLQSCEELSGLCLNCSVSSILMHSLQLDPPCHHQSLSQSRLLPSPPSLPSLFPCSILHPPSLLSLSLSHTHTFSPRCKENESKRVSEWFNFRLCCSCPCLVGYLCFPFLHTAFFFFFSLSHTMFSFFPYGSSICKVTRYASCHNLKSFYSDRDHSNPVTQPIQTLLPLAPATLAAWQYQQWGLGFVSVKAVTH